MDLIFKNGENGSIRSSSSASTCCIQDKSVVNPSRQMPQDDVELLSHLIEQASHSYSEGNLQKALTYYDQAVLVDPANNVLYANRSAIHLKLGQFEEAIDEASHSIQLNPDWPKAYFRKAEALSEAKQDEKALICYCQAVHLDQNNEKFLSSLIVRAQESSIRDNFNAAYKQMQELALEKSPFVVMSVIGQTFLQHYKHQTAILVLKIALEIDSPSLKLKESTLGSLAKAYHESKNLPRALDYLELQLELLVQLNDLKSQMEVHDNISKIALIQQNYQLALVHKDHQIWLAEKMGLNPALFVCDKGDIYEKLGRADEAYTCYNELLSSDPENYDVNMKLGSVLIQQHLYNDAIEFFQRAKSSSHDDNRELLALIRIGQCKLLLGDDEGALDILKQDMKNNTCEILGHVLDIFCASAEKNKDVVTLYKMAKRLLRAGIESKDNHLKTRAYYFLGCFYDHIGQTSASERLFKLYVKNVENSNSRHYSFARHVAALAKLGKIEFDAGHFDEAVQLAEKRLALIPDQAHELRAMALADLVQVYRKTGQNEKRMEFVEQIKKTIENSNNLDILWIQDKEMANARFDQGNWAEAKDLYEKALIAVQELNRNEHEAEICKQLGIVHQNLNFDDEAVVYLTQYLMLVQLDKNTSLMLDAHALLSKLYVDVEAWDSALEHIRCYLTLATILSLENDQLSALTMMGKTFARKEKLPVALKVLIKAKKIAMKLNSKQELAVCYGLLGEIHLKLGCRQKAVSNFCKQLSYFPFIADVELKCESIKHLIHEKCEGGDVNWTIKLIRLLQDISKEGKPHLQIDVHRNCSKIFQKMNRTDDAVKSLEKALILSIEFEHNDTVKILLDLCDLYKSTKQHFKAINALNNFAELQDGLCGPAIYYQLGLLYFKEDLIDECLDALNRCKEFDVVDNRFIYVLVCAYQKRREFQEALFWIEKLVEAAPLDAVIQEKLLWERFMLSLCAIQDYDVNSELYSLVQISMGDIHIFLDQLDLYGSITDNMTHLLPLKAQIHNSLSKQQYSLALNLIHSRTTVIDSNGTVDGFIFEKIISDYFLGNCPVIPDDDEDDAWDGVCSTDSDLELFHLDQKIANRINALVLTLNLSDSLVDVIFIMETCIWKEFKQEFASCGLIYSVPKPMIEDVDNGLQDHEAFVYVFDVEGLSLIWVNEGSTFQLYYRLDNARFDNLPVLYQKLLLDAVNLKNIPSYPDSPKFNKYLQIGEISGQYSQESLINCYPPKSKPAPENDLLFVGRIEEVENTVGISTAVRAPSDKMSEVYERMSNCAVVYVVEKDVDVREFHFSDLHRNNSSVKVAILQQQRHEQKINNSTKKLIKLLLKTSCQHVLVVFGNKYPQIHALLNQKIFTMLDIKELKRICGPDCRLISAPGATQTIEVLGLSKATRFVLKSTGKTSHFEFPEKYQISISNRIEKIFELYTRDIPDFEHINHLENDAYPYQKVKEYFKDNLELSQLLFGDYLLASHGQKHDFASDDVFQLMKSFDVRKRWRRSRKSNHKLGPSRNCLSDGEQAHFSDKDLTDTESVSGARVIGIEQDGDDPCHLFG